LKLQFGTVANATAGEFDGFKTLMLADASVIDVASPETGSCLNAGNVIDSNWKFS
jgi:hypothetical protein